MTPTIIILALIAAFLGLRLYSVLGKRTGHEQEPMMPQRDERPRIAPVLGTNAPAEPMTDTPVGTAPTPVPGMVFEPRAEIGVRALLAADRTFDVARFLSGAQMAYRMILEAFWSGDRPALRDLCDADSYAAFDAAISEREGRGETLANRLITIDSAIITDAQLQGNEAQIVVRFKADIAAITRAADGTVIAGSMTDAMVADDVWSFRRTIGSSDPNWLLDETDAG